MATSNIPLPSFQSRFVVEREDFSFSGNAISSNGGKGVDRALTKSGYYPIGVAGFEVSGSYGTFPHPYKYLVTDRQIGSCTLYAGLYNRATAAFSGNFYVWVIWMKV